jgi:DNA polymerase-3 subunit epsilon
LSGSNTSFFGEIIKSSSSENFITGFPFMLDLANAKFAFLDLETTGLSPWFGDRICEVGIILTEGKRIKQTYQTLVNPGRPLSPAAASTNRLTDEELTKAPLFSSIAGQVEACLQDAVVVCHNAPFDLQFLDSEFRRMGKEIEIPNLADTLTIAREIFDTPSYTLVSLAEAFDLDKVEAHRALADALTDRLVFFALMVIAQGLGRPLQDFIGLYNSPARPSEAIELPTELAEAIASGKQLHIAYVDGEGKKTQRMITPIQVLGLADYIYLRAYCHLRKAERSFRLDRILDVIVES